MDGARKGSPSEGSPQNGSPQKGSPEKGSQEKGSPEKGSQEKGSPIKHGRLTPVALFPDSVGFRENDPKQGFVYIIINVTGVQVAAKVVGKVKPLNVEIIDEAYMFKPKNVCLKINVSNDGKVQKYEYKKSLAKPIDPKASCIKFERNGQIKLRIRKSDAAISWAPYAQYLTCQDEPTE